MSSRECAIMWSPLVILNPWSFSSLYSLFYMYFFNWKTLRCCSSSDDVFVGPRNPPPYRNEVSLWQNITSKTSGSRSSVPVEHPLINFRFSPKWVNILFLMILFWSSTTDRRSKPKRRAELSSEFFLWKQHFLSFLKHKHFLDLHKLEGGQME